MQDNPTPIPFEEEFERQAVLTEVRQEEMDDIRNLLDSPSYSLAFLDRDFLMSDASRSIRLELEANKPEYYQRKFGVRSTVIVFGSARFVSRKKSIRLLAEAEGRLESQPESAELKDAVRRAERAVEMSEFYEQAREFARIVSEENGTKNCRSGDGPYDYVICTGGGPGIMEAANRGAYEVGAPSVGLNIKLPYEQQPNPYITPELCFQFHYFNVRKLHFMLRAKALVACPGGFGTFDELFEALTLRQTERMQRIPIILFGERFWSKCVNFNYLVETGVINREDLELFHFTESPREAWDIIRDFHGEK